MKTKKKQWLICCVLFVLATCLLGVTPGTAAPVSSQVITGSDGWLFLQQELRFLNTGPFWGEHAKSASRAARADAQDPTPAITAFQQALAKKGITLLLVPVPPKALIYSEYLPAADKGKEWGKSLDKYYSILRQQGIQVIDLRQDLLDAKTNQDKPLYCREDTHWSGYGVTVAAKVIAREINTILPKGNTAYTEQWRDIQITGDLRQMLDDKQEKLETVSIQKITDAAGQSPQSDPASPLLILGDSHVLVFHDGGDMFAKGAGISDQLAFTLGMPMDVIGVRGSGATPARLSLYRKAQRNPEYWTGKKAVVWCFAAREFTETDGWRVLPIEP